MDSEKIIAALRRDLQIHTFDTFLEQASDETKGIIVSGCPACKKRLQSLNQFMSHLFDDVIPATVRRACADSDG